MYKYLKTTGSKVKFLREKADWKQEELSLKSGVSQGSISRIEKEQQKNITQAILKKLAAAFNISVQELMPPQKNIPAAIPHDDKYEDFFKLSKDPQFKHLVASYKTYLNLPYSDRQQITGSINFLFDMIEKAEKKTKKRRKTA